MEATAPVHQVALFKSAPRDYLNLGSLKSPYLVSYYIDESFHTTWVVRGRTKFKNLKGEDGLKFFISDYPFSLSKVEAVLVSELPEYFKTTGPGVDIILGRDFLTAYSFLFFKKTQHYLQLSKSCINRCKWPDQLGNCLDFYTAWDINEADKSQAGTAAFVNICSPFSTWRPYKPCYWDPKEDIGLCAMTQAMKTASQMPISYPGPVINIITNDKYAFETSSRFLKVKYEDLSTCKHFQTLKPRLRDIVSRLLEYRMNYAVRNSLEELSCVNTIDYKNGEHRKSYRIENMEYAVRLARLGAKMKEFDVKGQLRSQLPTGQYYYFDTKMSVLAISKKETNKTLKEILQSYQQLTGCGQMSPSLVEYTSTDDEISIYGLSGDTTSTLTFVPEKKPSTPMTITMSNTHEHDNHRKFLDEEVSVHSLAEEGILTPIPTLASERKSWTPKFTAVPAIKTRTRHSHLINFDLEEDLEKMQQSGYAIPELNSILNRLKSSEVTSNDETAIHKETDAQLKNFIKQVEEKSLARLECQRRNCDTILTEAHKQHNQLIAHAAQVAKHFRGYVEGHFNGQRVSQEAAEQPIQRMVGPTNLSTVDLTPIGLPWMDRTRLERSAGEIGPATTHELAENKATADAQRRLEKHRLAVQKLQESGRLPKVFPMHDKISSIECYFIKPGEATDLGGVPEKPNDDRKKIENPSEKSQKTLERSKMKKAKSRLEPAEVDLAAKFSAIDLDWDIKKRYNKGWLEDNESTKGTKIVETDTSFNKKTKPTATRVLGGAIWPKKKGSGKLLEADYKKPVTKKQDTEEQMHDCSNLVAELNMFPKECAIGQKRSIRMNMYTDTKADLRKTPMLNIEDARPPTNGSSQNTIARYPGGALSLANIGGIPGDQHSGDLKHVKFAEVNIDHSSNSDFKDLVIISGTAINDLPEVRMNGEQQINTSTMDRRSTSISYTDLANMTELSAGGVQRILGKSLGTVGDVMKACPELVKVTETALNLALGGPASPPLELDLREDLICAPTALVA